ncbi:MAG: lysophospholipid acyltransferase family protein [Planctomycetes bacterium]|nr:lysophospholipid acyltransferase family protein [Planctomycetota bacterium]
MDAQCAASLLKPLLAFPTHVLERLLGLSCLNRMYATYSSSAASTAGRFCDRALAELAIETRVAGAELALIPRQGPLVVVANHPFGAVEGLILESLIGHVRPDVKVLANSMLHRIPEVRAHTIFVDPFGGPDAARRNVGPLRAAMNWLVSGGVLIVFPAGEVAHFRLRRARIVEPAWSPTVARLARRSGAAVLPVFIAGRNSLWFQLAGLIHPRLRTALLPRELLRARGTRVAVRIGSPVSAERLAALGDARQTVEHLRLRTLLLGTRDGDAGGRETINTRDRAQPLQPVIGPASPDALAREVASLPPSARVSGCGEFEVFVAYADRIPRLLREIGRLREVTFRAVGEGTGGATDLDRFDTYYLHLFAWDRRRCRIVGAYRLGFTEDIVPCRGVEALYTNTLFRFERPLLKQLGPAMELGRSFVTDEYQKSYAALLALWKGIAAVVTGRPECRRLFGVVSISADYTSTTRDLLRCFLEVNRVDADLARLVHPRTPVPRRWTAREEPAFASRTARDIEQVDDLVREIEKQERGVPILLRQYLKLDAKVLGFNIDPAFGGVLDALMVVDLTQVQRPILDRFFGRQAAAAFLACHRNALAVTAPCESAHKP